MGHPHPKPIHFTNPFKSIDHMIHHLAEKIHDGVKKAIQKTVYPWTHLDQNPFARKLVELGHITYSFYKQNRDAFNNMFTKPFKKETWVKVIDMLKKDVFTVSEAVHIFKYKLNHLLPGNPPLGDLFEAGLVAGGFGGVVLAIESADIIHDVHNNNYDSLQSAIQTVGLQIIKTTILKEEMTVAKLATAVVQTEVQNDLLHNTKVGQFITSKLTMNFHKKHANIRTNNSIENRIKNMPVTGKVFLQRKQREEMRKRLIQERDREIEKERQKEIEKKRMQETARKQKLNLIKTNTDAIMKRKLQLTEADVRDIDRRLATEKDTPFARKFRFFAGGKRLYYPQYINMKKFLLVQEMTKKIMSEPLAMP